MFKVKLRYVDIQVCMYFLRNSFAVFIMMFWQNYSENFTVLSTQTHIVCRTAFVYNAFLYSLFYLWLLLQIVLYEPLSVTIKTDESESPHRTL